MDADDGVSRFFAYARERHAIYLRRQAGVPRDQLTEDPILRKFRFCNVFRELDTTTLWLKNNVREPLRSRPEVLLAVVIYRWFNRVETGKAIWDVNGDIYDSPFERLLAGGKIGDMRDSIMEKLPKGPYVTGSYIIKTPDGVDKLTGVLQCTRKFMRACPQAVGWRNLAQDLLDHRLDSPGTMEKIWNWLRQHEYIGDFMAYEIVSDLIYTDLLDRAPDIMTWANAGPGAKRGLNRMKGRPLEKQIPKAAQCEEMQQLLWKSRKPEYWPQIVHDSVSAGLYVHEIGIEHLSTRNWPAWDMRTVEHTLCEFDKYERVRLGEGEPRQRFKP